MHFPLEIGYGNFTISSHLLFESLAFIIGYRYYIYLRKQQQDRINDSNRLWILIAATFGAVFGSRLLGAFENPSALFHSENLLLYIYANKTIVGGLLGGLLFVEIAKKLLHVQYSSGNLFTYPLILAMCIGRIGCFTTGIYEQTYGIETDSIFGMDLGDGLNRHPVTLYEIAYLMMVYIFLKLMERKKMLADGNRFKLFMIAYLLFRIAIDFIKPGVRYLFGLGTIQLVSLLGLLYYCKTIYYLFLKPQSLFVNAD